MPRTLLALLACSGDPATPEPTPNNPPAPVATVTVTPPSGVLVSIEETLQRAAVARTETGSELSGKTFTWSSSDSTVATVSASGTVTAVATGRSPSARPPRV